MSADNVHVDESPSTDTDTNTDTTDAKSRDYRGKYKPTMPPEWRYEHSGYIDPHAFADDHDIIEVFVPFSSHECDRFEMLQAVQRSIHALPGTAQHITRTRVAKLNGVPVSGLKHALPDEFFLLHNAYPCPDDVFNDSASNDSGMKFANPRYLEHDELDRVTDSEGRIEWLDRYTALGTLRHEDIYHHFGYTSSSSLNTFIKRNDYDWRGNRKAGYRRMARTWKLLSSWGYSVSDIAVAFATTYEAVKSAISKKAGDFEPPSDPTTTE